MPASQILGIRNTAEVTRKFPEEIETTTVDNVPLLARSMWIRFERHINKGWSVSELKISAALRKSYSAEWRNDFYYYPQGEFVVNDELQRQIDELKDIITEDSKRTMCTNQ